MYFSAAIGATKFEISNIKLHVSVVTLSTQNNSKLPQNLKSRSKRYLIEININQDQYQNQFLDYLTDPTFQLFNNVFVLKFETSETGRTLNTRHLLKL